MEIKTEAEGKELRGFYKALADNRKSHTQKQIDEATAWVLKKFGHLILYEGKPGKQEARLFFRWYVTAQKHRDAGLTKSEDGWRFGISLFAEHFATVYIEPILDKSIIEDNEAEGIDDRLQAILDLDTELNFGYAQYFERWPEMWVEFPKGEDT